MTENQEERLHSYGRLDSWMGIIMLKAKIGKIKSKNFRYIWVDLHHWQFPGFSRKLKFCLLQMVQIQVGIPKRMNKLPRI